MYNINLHGPCKKDVMATMKAIRVHQFGDSKQLKLESNVPRPQPDDDQVLVQVKAVGVNPLDPYVRTGGFGPQPFPYIPGMDFACLLYTSPSPRDATLSRMPSSA